MSRFATTFSRRAGTVARVARRPRHDPIAPRPGRRRACPPSRHPARPRPAVRPRMAISRRTRCRARSELPCDADDVLYRCRTAAPCVPMAAALHGGVAAGLGRVAGRAGSRPRPALAPSGPPSSRPARDVRRLLEHRHTRHHRLADRRIRATGGFRSRAHDSSRRRPARPRRDIEGPRTCRRGRIDHIDEHHAAAQDRDACREHDGIAARHSARRTASPASDVRRAACRPCFATSGSRPAHGESLAPHTGHTEVGWTSADPARRGRHRQTRSARPTAAHGRHARDARLARRSGHVDCHRERAARHSAGAPERGRHRLDIAPVAPPRDRRAGRIRALTSTQ